MCLKRKYSLIYNLQGFIPPKDGNIFSYNVCRSGQEIAQTSLSVENKKKMVFGFTLVEVILVIMLFAIIAGLTLPNFSRTYSNILVKQTTQDLAYLMRYAQSRAMNKNVKIRLVLDVGKNSYWLEEENTDGQADEGSYKKVNGNLGRVVKMPGDINIESEKSDVIFNSDGSIDKMRIIVCREDNCYTVSSKEIRGQINVLSGKIL